jgi:hypothetical protein
MTGTTSPWFANIDNPHTRRAYEADLRVAMIRIGRPVCEICVSTSILPPLTWRALGTPRIRVSCRRERHHRRAGALLWRAFER